VPPHGGERSCGVRLHRRPRDGHTLPRSIRDLGSQAGLHTISPLDRPELREGPAYASPIDFANTVINAPSGQAATWHGMRGVNKTVATGASVGPGGDRLGGGGCLDWPRRLRAGRRGRSDFP
jgi:hypothetical protein